MSTEDIYKLKQQILILESTIKDKNKDFDRQNQENSVMTTKLNKIINTLTKEKSIVNQKLLQENAKMSQLEVSSRRSLEVKQDLLAQALSKNVASVERLKETKHLESEVFKTKQELINCGTNYSSISDQLKMKDKMYSERITSQKNEFVKKSQDLIENIQEKFNEKLSNLQKRYEANKEQLAKTEKQKIIFQTDANDIKKKYDNQLKKYASMEQDLSKQIALSKTVSTEQKLKIMEEKAKLDRLNVSLAYNEKQVNNKNITITNLEKNIVNINENKHRQLVSLQEKNQKIESQYKNQLEKMNAAEKALINKYQLTQKNEQEKFNKYTGLLNDKIISLNNQINSLKNEHGKQDKSNINNVRKLQEQFTKEMKKQNDLLNVQLNKVKDLERKLATITKEQIESHKKIEQLSKSLLTCNEQKLNFSKQSEERYNTLQKQYQISVQLQKTTQGKLSQQEKLVSSLQTKQSDLSNEIELNRKDLGMCNVQLKENQYESNKIRKLADELESESNSKSNTIMSLNAKIEELSNVISSQSEKIKSLGSQHDSCKQNVKDSTKKLIECSTNFEKESKKLVETVSNLETCRKDGIECLRMKQMTKNENIRLEKESINNAQLSRANAYKLKTAQSNLDSAKKSLYQAKQNISRQTSRYKADINKTKQETAKREQDMENSFNTQLSENDKRWKIKNDNTEKKHQEDIKFIRNRTIELIKNLNSLKSETESVFHEYTDLENAHKSKTKSERKSFNIKKRDLLEKRLKNIDKLVNNTERELDQLSGLISV
jgi:hypothetical protein